MEQLSIPDREAKTRRQLALVDTALTKEFATLPASVVHREVATVSDGLIANARFTDHVAVLTGRFAAEHLSTALPPVEHQTRSIALQEIAPDKRMFARRRAAAVSIVVASRSAIKRLKFYAIICSNVR